MKDLYFSELRRFGRLTLLAAVAHMLLLVFMNRLLDLLQQAYFESAPFFAFYLLLGLAFGVVQVGSYRKPSQWAWLVHRPLSTERIFSALALSALTVLALVLFLPMLLLVLGNELFTTRVVDARHYLAPLHLLAFTMMAWLAAAHACVSRSKAAIAVIAAPVLLALHLVSVWWLLLPVLLALGWLAFITMRSFRANREAPIQGTAALLLTALPLQLGIYLLVFELGQFLFVTGGILLGVDPLNTEFPPKGGLIEVERALPNEELVLGLDGSSDPRAASWREQLPLMEPLRVGPHLQRFPIRQQLSNFQLSTQWYDEERGILWTFDHDEMLFHGRDPEGGSARGWWGVNGVGASPSDVQPFTEIPVATPEGHLMTRAALYAVDKDDQRQHQLLHLAEGEWFVDLPRQEFNRVIVLTNQRLLAWRSDRRAASAFAPLLLDWQVNLPRGPAHLEMVTIAELMDGWLVSFVYGDGMRQIGFSQFTAAVEPFQQVLFVDDEGGANVVSERALRRDYPALYQVGWWFSPVLHSLAEWPDAALDKGLTWPLEWQPLPPVKVFYPVAVVLTLLSLVLAWWWLRGSQASATRRRVWLASCALLGLPAFVSLVLLEPRT